MPPMPPGPTPVPTPPPGPTTQTAAPGTLRREPPRTPGKLQPLALKTLADKVARYPELAFLRNEYGSLLVQNGRLEEGVAQYEQAVRMNPAFAVAWNNLGVAQQALGRHAAAKKAYRRAIRISPAYALAWYNLGVVYDSQKHYTKAVELYQKGIELDPSLLDLRHNPQIASNRLVTAVVLKSYLDKGGSVVLPIQSSYPAPRGAVRP